MTTTTTDLPTDKVDGQRVYDANSKTWIPFKSRSDALLANLMLRHSFTFNQLNLVLETIQDPTFDKDQTTLRAPADVMSAISFEGKRLADERSRSEQVWEQRKPGIPFVVLQLVVDTFKDEMASFEEDVAYYAPLSAKRASPCPSLSVRQDLLNLTLVHRAWTSTARSALQRRVVLAEPRQVVSFMRSVYCGAQVHELILEITLKFVDRQTFLDSPSLFAGLFACAPNIRSLCLKISGIDKVSRSSALRASDEIRLRMTGENAVKSIKGLTQLRRLFIIAGTTPVTFWNEICDTISNLNSLDFLCIAGTQVGYHDPRYIKTPQLPLTPPPRSLRTVEFRSFRTGYIPKEVLSWLFTPSFSIANAVSASPTIRSLAVALGEAEASLLDTENPEEKQAVSKMWASLDTLDCNRGSLNRIQQVMPLCTSLRRLTIGPEVFWQLAESVAHITEMLEQLTLKCDSERFIGVHDVAASKLLNRANGNAKKNSGNVMKRLQKLEFLFHEAALRGRELERWCDTSGRFFYNLGREHCMNETSNACHSLGIEFKVDKFLDFMEAPIVPDP